MVVPLPGDLAALLPRVVALAEDSGRAAHHVIATGLAALTPDMPVISEQGGVPSPTAREDWSSFWLVGSLGGDRESAAGRPECRVNIALIHHGVPVLGVVHLPRDGTTYSAARSVGTWRSRPGQPATRLLARPPALGSGLRVAEGRSQRSTELDRVLAAYDVRQRVATGSSLELWLVTEGAADCYIQHDPTMEWDVAAGDAVFRWAVPDGIAPHASPLAYNKPDLRNGAFVLGFLPPRPAVVWLTGLSGSGKSTIAARLVAALTAKGARVEWLDGDEIRALFPSTGFTRSERDAHVRRVGFLASRLEAHGVTAVASLVSPYRDSRAFARSLCGNFLEVHVATPLEECERRDPKGLYRRARAGMIANFTGLDDPYEVPEVPEITIDTTAVSPEEAAARIVAALVRVPSPPASA